MRLFCLFACVLAGSISARAEDVICKAITWEQGDVVASRSPIDSPVINVSGSEYSNILSTEKLEIRIGIATEDRGFVVEVLNNGHLPTRIAGQNNVFYNATEPADVLIECWSTKQWKKRNDDLCNGPRAQDKPESATCTELKKDMTRNF